MSLYPICNEQCEILAELCAWVDRRGIPVHFWDPMTGDVAFAVPFAPCNTTAARIGMGMIMTIITTTTRMRGAIG